MFCVILDPRDPCQAKNRCMSRGECTTKWLSASRATYKCKCEPKYTGKNCEHGRPNTVNIVFIDIIIIVRTLGLLTSS